MAEPEKGTAEVVAALVTNLQTPRFMQFDAGVASAIAIPKGLELKSVKPFLDEFRSAPERREGSAALQSIDSFIAHVKRFADADSVIFADRDELSLTAVLDYHRAGADGAPRFGAHTSVYACPISSEWAVWREGNGKPMAQKKFAEFIEDRISDIADPAAAGPGAKEFASKVGVEYASASKLIELSRGISLRENLAVRQHINLSTGEGQISYEATHATEAGAPLKVPGAFLIAIPVFRSETPYKIPVRLRYRVNSGSITWFYEMYRADAAFDDAFKEACDLTAKETGLPLLYGRPEC